MTDQFNPKDRLIKISAKGGKEQPYLQAHDAILWFRTDYPAPEGRILTFVDIPNRIVRAEIYLGDALIATGHSLGDGSKSLEKLETNAIRRALANAGYGTVAALAEEDSDARVAMAAHEIPTEAVRERLGSGGGRRIEGEVNNPNYRPSRGKGE
ncbi:MAG TPA: hypothetical protein VFU31_22120 [Candidatus Binatia bacterium]|nr:hypothetical protein [Candidatus Binatia bacterium]